MRKLFGKEQWWRSPPALVLSVIAAAALLFFSGKAALNAFAEGEEDRTYVVQYITGIEGYKANAAGTTYEGVPATTMTVTNNPESVYLLNAIVPQKDKYHFQRWKVHNAGTGGDEYYTSNSSLPVSYFSQVGETNVYVTTATAEYDRKLVVKYDKNTTDNVNSMPATATFYDSNTAYADGYTLTAGTGTVRQGNMWKRWLRTSDGNQAVEKLALSDFNDSTWSSTEKAYVITVYADWNKAYRVNATLRAAAFEWEEVDMTRSDYNKRAVGANLDTVGYYRQHDNGEEKVYRKVCARNADDFVALDADGKVQWLDNDGVQGDKVILQKLELVSGWLKEHWNITLDDLRYEVQHRQFATNPDGSFKRAKNGRLLNRLTEPADEDPSVTLMEYLVRWVTDFEKLRK